MRTATFGALSSKFKRAQSTLELTLSLVVIVLLLAGSIKLFIWISSTLVKRDRAYMRDWKNNYDESREFYHPAPANLVP